MTTAKMENLFEVLKELRDGQQAQIELTKEALAAVKSDTATRATSIANLLEEWNALAKQQNERAARRHRTQVRIYGLMMVVFGAFFALQLLRALKS